MEALYADMISLREHTKLLHFQTKSLTVHTTTDAFITDFDLLSDAFWEVFQSNDFRLNFSKPVTITLKNISKPNELLPILKKVEKKLTVFTSNSPARVSADNLLERINRFKYLLTFK